jgi:hypothetical protein
MNKRDSDKKCLMLEVSTTSNKSMKWWVDIWRMEIKESLTKAQLFNKKKAETHRYFHQKPKLNQWAKVALSKKINLDL